MAGGITEGGMYPKPEFIAEHDGPEVYMPSPFEPGGRSARILEETARRLGWSGPTHRREGK